MIHRGYYFYDPPQKHLWIVPAKCGSASFSALQGTIRPYRGLKKGDEWVRASIVVRHPFERLISALKELKLPYTSESILNNLRETHITPMTGFLGGREAVRPVALEHLPLIIEGFPHKNKGQHPPWAATAVDWARIRPHYEEDFELCLKSV